MRACLTGMTYPKGDFLFEDSSLSLGMSCFPMTRRVRERSSYGLSYVALVLPEAPKTLEFFKVGPKVSFRRVPESRSIIGQIYTNSYTFDLLLFDLVFRDPPPPPETYFRPYLNFRGFLGASRRTRAT